MTQESFHRNPLFGWLGPRRFIVIASLAGIALAAVAGLFVLRITQGGSASTSAATTEAAIAQRWGIQVKQIAVTADGGLVDFRFVVIDADKALNMMLDVNNLPVLRAEDTNTVVNSAAQMSARHDLNAGATYFLLYRNADGALHPGSRATVAFGDLRLQHVEVK